MVNAKIKPEDRQAADAATDEAIRRQDEGEDMGVENAYAQAIANAREAALEEQFISMSETYERDVSELCNERDRLQAIVDKQAILGDGGCATIGDTVYAMDRDENTDEPFVAEIRVGSIYAPIGVSPDVGPSIAGGDQFDEAFEIPASECYSTPEAAEQAKEEK